MDIKISKDVDRKIDEGFAIHIEAMTSQEFDAIRILLKSLVENDKRFSRIGESHLDLKYLVSLVGSLKE